MRPWEGAGEVLLAHLARDVEPERSLQGIAQLVRAYDAAGAVELTILPDSPPDLAGVLNAAASIATDIAGRRRLDALARAFDRPRAWVLGFEQHPGGVADELEQLFEGVRKLTPPHQPLFLPLVILGHRGRGRKGTDLSVGYPSDSLYGSGSTSGHRLWSVYLHWRVAWFTGGRPGWAERVAPMVTGNLRLGDDDAFERRIGDVAETTWRDLPPENQSMVVEWMKYWPNPDSALTRDLVELDALWHPAHDPGRGLQLVPWIARALLRRQRHPTARSYLRGCDACEPLAIAALARCLHLEAVLKSRADAARGGITDADALSVNPDLQKLRTASLNRPLVPGTSAARADMLFDFAGLNDVLGFLKDATLHDLGVQLRDVRNTIAHGHPPSWAMVTTLGELWRKLVP